MVEWAHGNDALTYTLEEIADNVLEALPAFEMARFDFECEAGQKIGITWNDEGANPDSVTADRMMDFAAVRENFGRRDDVNLYTGEIKVGCQHIEHDTNTYVGCSGSLIFLLDKDQPDSVQEEDHDKVIAIHVGCKEGFPYNIGLKLVGAGVKPMSSYGEINLRAEE